MVGVPPGREAHPRGDGPTKLPEHGGDDVVIQTAEELVKSLVRRCALVAAVVETLVLSIAACALSDGLC